MYIPLLYVLINTTTNNSNNKYDNNNNKKYALFSIRLLIKCVIIFTCIII